MLRRMITDFLFLDTTVFLVIALVLTIGYRFARKHLDRLRFTRTIRFFILVLFPWLLILLWLTKPVTKMRRRNRRLYKACYLFFIRTTLLLILVGILIQNNVLADWGAIVHVWIVLLDLLAKRENNGGSDTNHDDQPPPDDPTPTGDAVERWLWS